MWNQLSIQVAGAFERFGDALLAVIPALLVLLASILVGAVVGVLLRGLVSLLERLARGRRREPERTSVPSRLLSAAGVRADPRHVAGLASFWVAVAVALAVGVNALQPSGLKAVLTDVVGFLPRLFGAALIVVLGAGLAALARRSVLVAAVNAGVPWARTAARLVHVAALSFFFASALDHLGVGSAILVAAFSIAAGSVALALALAFGLGARDLARQWLEKQLRAEHDDTGIRHV